LLLLLLHVLRKNGFVDVLREPNELFPRIDGIHASRLDVLEVADDAIARLYSPVNTY
jgi:hypothetical protein